jgi:hypothetical protein
MPKAPTRAGTAEGCDPMPLTESELMVAFWRGFRPKLDQLERAPRFFGVDSGRGLRRYYPALKKRLSHSRIRGLEGGQSNCPGRRP